MLVLYAKYKYQSTITWFKIFWKTLQNSSLDLDLWKDRARPKMGIEDHARHKLSQKRLKLNFNYYLNFSSTQCLFNSFSSNQFFDSVY